jgi:hypothetical protein
MVSDFENCMIIYLALVRLFILCLVSKNYTNIGGL